MTATSSHDRYENPLIARYASEAMARLWGDQRKFSTWRRLWVSLAEAEREMGLAITDQQIAELLGRMSMTSISTQPISTSGSCGMM